MLTSSINTECLKIMLKMCTKYTLLGNYAPKEYKYSTNTHYFEIGAALHHDIP
jgi:hypothetical protein